MCSLIALKRDNAQMCNSDIHLMSLRILSTQQHGHYTLKHQHLIHASSYYSTIHSSTYFKQL